MDRILVVGAPCSGKSSLSDGLAVNFISRGRTVVIADAEPPKSDPEIEKWLDEKEAEGIADVAIVVRQLHRRDSGFGADVIARMEWPLLKRFNSVFKVEKSHKVEGEWR